MSACSVSNITVTDPDTKITCTASHKSFLKNYSDIKMNACGAKGNADEAKVDNTLSDAILNALVKGLNP
ncbi:MAG: hypothetical protein GQ540_03505 [Lutibacter sp.]|uniref:hypothetical protein n=1 Tax=Lutibacter sp. TaxID=1925666 RepID=UPI0019F26B85|nr:hypothetical protein [Lutibacter sp.]NOR27579.1 hypothetical protein [Lutibacter sp.]